MLTTAERTRLLEQIAEQAVPQDIDLWPALRLRAQRRRRELRAWLLPGVAAAVVAIVVGAGLLLGLRGAQSVSAETILDRAAGAAGDAATVDTYHLTMLRQNDTTEVWFGGPDRQRTTEHAQDATGAPVLVQDVIFNGAETWLVSNDNGQLRVIHTLGTQWNKPADAPSAQGGLSELLSRYSTKQCMAVHLEPQDASVAGQSTYVLDVAKTAAACPAPAASSPVAAPSPGPSQVRVTGQLQGSRLDNVNLPTVRVWVDKQSFLPLKTEVRDASGTVLEHSEVTHVEYNVTIPDAIFSYAPPAGVSVSTFNGGTGADVKRAMAAKK
jgi:outer membrane lipoprotein-sorting protein